MKFIDKNKTFSHIAKNDRRDFIESEVGDIKQPDRFIPQVKIKRFDNEYNVSIRYKNDDIGTEKVNSSDGKVIWKKGKTEARFYEIDDGHEFEVVFDEKPSSNVVEFTIRTKGVVFYYQPELTKEEIAQGRERPEDVVGSYAIYAENPKKNHDRGRKYRVGKIGHIYRPKVIDSDGKEVWGELYIDQEKGILRITIPQDFLDSGKYPIIVDPTFGYSGVGGSSLNVYDNIPAFCSLYNTHTAVSGDIAKQMHFYAKKVDSNETFAVSLYRIESGTPTSKFGTADSINVNSTTAQWWDTAVVSDSMTAGHTYGVAYGGWSGDVLNPSSRIYYDSGSGSNISSREPTEQSLPATWDEDNTYSDLLSLYVTYQAPAVDINYAYFIFIDKGDL